MYTAAPHTFRFSHAVGSKYDLIYGKYTFIPTTAVTTLLLLLVPLLVVLLPKPGKSTGMASSRGAILSKNVGDTSKF